MACTFLFPLQEKNATNRWAWQTGPASYCQCNGGDTQEAPGCGPGLAGPVMFKTPNRGPGWTGPGAFHTNEALQRRAAKGRPC
eukprot:3819124-Amphidinium_carterae.1